MNVTIRIVHKDSARRDAMMPHFPCFITIRGTHNHSTSSAEALKQLRVLQSTKKIFEKYFQLGMTSAEAARFHLMKMSLVDDLFGQAPNATNPTPRAIAHMRAQWVKKEHGGLNTYSVFEALEKYSKDNPEVTLKVIKNDNQFCVALLTPFMKRIHKDLREAGEIVFVDATGCVDQLNTAVIPILCSGPAGAVPLAVLITSSLDEATLTKGFSMVKDCLGPSAFYGRGAPECFMTDNCDAERNALKANWPTAQLFLCIFHLLQQVWRWLLDGKHGIDKESRQQLMGLVKPLVYAKSPESFLETWVNFQSNSLVKRNSNFLSFMTALVERKEEWGIAFCAGALLRGHHTNNFCGSAICIIKEIVLRRCKAFNVSQLVVEIVEIFDVYMRQRLVDVALGKRRIKTINNDMLLMESVTSLGDKKYVVKSQSNANEVYEVDLSIGMCTCPRGENGTLCEHQVACAEFSVIECPQNFVANPKNRHWLATLAIGEDKIPYESFFIGLTNEPQEMEVTRVQVKTEDADTGMDFYPCTDDMVDVKEEALDTTNIKNVTIEEKAQDACDVFLDVVRKFGVESPEGTILAIDEWIQQLKLVKTTNNLHSLLHKQCSAIMKGGSGCGKIP